MGGDRDWQADSPQRLQAAVCLSGNIVDTVEPHFLRSLDRSLIQQSSPWGFVHRDQAAVDSMFRILLHYAVQGFIIERWLAPDRALAEAVASYDLVAVDIHMVKSGVSWRFVGDTFAETWPDPPSSGLRLWLWQFVRLAAGHVEIEPAVRLRR